MSDYSVTQDIFISRKNPQDPVLRSVKFKISTGASKYIGVVQILKVIEKQPIVHL